MINLNAAESNLVLPQLNILAFVDFPFLPIGRSGSDGGEGKGVEKIAGR